MSRKLITLLVGMVLLGSAILRGDESPPNALQMLRSERPAVRESGKKDIVKMYTDTTRGLEDIIRESLREDYETEIVAKIDKREPVGAKYSAAVLAMELLGELRSAGSVELLARYLRFSVTRGSVRGRLPTIQQDYPSAAALVKIGLPSLPAVLDAYVREGKRVRFQTLQIIRNVLGTECGKQYLKERLAEAKERDRRAALTELLEALSA